MIRTWPRPPAVLIACILPLGLAGPPSARAGVAESTVSYESQGKAIAVDRFGPDGPGKHPAVLLIHGAGGLTGGVVFREYARLLAQRGYVAHVVHYFDRTGDEVAKLPSSLRNFSAWRAAVSDAISHAAAQPNVDPSRIGLVGFSLGAYLSLSLAADDPRVTAVVDYFGGLPAILGRDVKAMPPVLILHGEQDRVVPVQAARELERMLKEKGRPYEIHIYPDQGHGFRGDDSQDAFRRTVAFLDKHLKM
jgi:dienelactone hydrolase